MTTLMTALENLPHCDVGELKRIAKRQDMSLSELVSEIIYDWIAAQDGFEISIDRGRVLRVSEAAKRIGLSEHTLNKMRSRGSGPRFVKLTSRAVGYHESDLVAYARERSRRSTAKGARSADTAPPHHRSRLARA